MKINIFDLAGYTPNLFEYEPLNILNLINTILLGVPDKDWSNPICHEEPETPNLWVEYYRQSAVNGELLKLDDIVFKNHWKSYHSFYDSWNCPCGQDDKPEWCSCEDNNSLAQCSQW